MLFISIITSDISFLSFLMTIIFSVYFCISMRNHLIAPYSVIFILSHNIYDKIHNTMTKTRIRLFQYLLYHIMIYDDFLRMIAQIDSHSISLLICYTSLPRNTVISSSINIISFVVQIYSRFIQRGANTGYVCNRREIQTLSYSLRDTAKYPLVMHSEKIADNVYDFNNFERCFINRNRRWSR